jgi:transposase
MPVTKSPYAAEFKQQMVELVRAGRTPAQRSREFKCGAPSISTWVVRDATDNARPQRARVRDVLSSAEREELARLRRENRQLKMERDILAKAMAWFAGKDGKTSIGFTTS